MKKYTSYIGILVVGLFLGWFLFGGSTADEATHEHHETTTKSQRWTCSMHPQIMQPEAGDCPICGMDLIPANTTADGLDANQFKMSKNALALANIQTLKIGEATLYENQLFLSGKVVENENYNAVQAAHFGGRVEKLYIKSLGENIKEGQLIALVYSPELVTAQNELLVASSLKTKQPSLYKAVRNKLKLWKLSNTQIETIEKSRKTIVNFPMYANVAGVATRMMVQEGSYVKEGEGLFKVANLQTVWAEFDVFEKQIPMVKKGSEISVTTNTGSNKTITANISFVDPILNAKTRTVVARTVLNNTHRNLKPGMFVNGVLRVGKSKSKGQLAVPKTAVLWTGKRSLVYVKSSQDPVFEMREVTLGKSIGKNVEIISGLKLGEEIVVNGTFTVDAAAQLQGKKSMMNKSGGVTTTGHEGHAGMNTAVVGNLIKSKMKQERITVSKPFQKQLHQVVEAYIKLKDALVASDAKRSKKYALLLENELAKVDMKLLQGRTAHEKWMPLQKSIKKTTNSMLKSVGIKTQRIEFISVSSNLIKAVQIFGINKEIYHQYCPMANNDKGANWLSFQEDIKNPYFGDAMLTCGNVEEIIN